MDGRKRPIGVTVVAVLVLLSALGTIVFSIPALGLGPPLSTAQIVLNLVFAAILLYIAYGLFTLKPWAWITTIVLEVLNGIFAILAIAGAPAAPVPWIQLVIAIAVVAYLTRPRVREAFGRLALRGPGAP